MSTIPISKSGKAIPSMTDSASVVGGADTHADTIHVALITALGQNLADKEFPTTPQGYRDAVAFLSAQGPIDQVGIEGTSSYGAGFSRAVAAAGIDVIEVNRPNRAERRRRGKSDPLDAYQAARTVLAGEATSAPKNASVDAIRSLHNTRRSGVKARTATMNQITAMLVTAPDPIRAKYLALQALSLVTALARCRPTTTDPLNLAVLTALKTLAERHQFLTTQNDQLTTLIDSLVTQANPALRAAHGVGPATAAQLLVTAGANPDRLRSEASFAALCGVCPIPASSGKTTRHRLSRGGARNANNALYRIALDRMSSHRTTREYVSRQVEAGRSKDAQSCHCPRDVRVAHQHDRGPRVRRPPRHPPNQEHHRHRRGRRLQRLAHSHFPRRTRTPTRRRPRRPLPNLAQRGLTTIGASVFGTWCPGVSPLSPKPCRRNFANTCGANTSGRRPTSPPPAAEPRCRSSSSTSNSRIVPTRSASYARPYTQDRLPPGRKRPGFRRRTFGETALEHGPATDTTAAADILDYTPPRVRRIRADVLAIAAIRRPNLRWSEVCDRPACLRSNP